MAMPGIDLGWQSSVTEHDDIPSLWLSLLRNPLSLSSVVIMTRPRPLLIFRTDSLYHFVVQGRISIYFRRQCQPVHTRKYKRVLKDRTLRSSYDLRIIHIEKGWGGGGGGGASR